ncbi:MAG TPA: FtsX-like permease family protein [Puia sp.]|nr:FtsX-like permease family protein [Puia sp.]
MKKDKQFPISWLFLMAWRDSRHNRSRLFLFISSIILGIAALVATLSFGNNLRDAIDDQAKALVGADLVIRGNKYVPPPIRKLLDSLPNRHSEECSFASMVYFTKSQGTRLVQVRALDGDYPFYGSLETTPISAGRSFRGGRQALVDKTLMLQYGAQVGDSIKIGECTFAIAGVLNKAPGRNEISTTVAPPVYIPFQYLAKTRLLEKGSRVEYQLYYQYDPGADMEKFAGTIRPRLEKSRLDEETVESRKKRMSRAFGDFTQFLTLISFIALLLGCIGVASAVHIYIREKIPAIAILRCLGVKARQAFLIYLIQVAGIGLIGSVIGSALGLAVQQVLPAVLKDLLPLEARMGISWWAVGQGITVGLIVSVLFALLPLLSIRSISPLYTLRLSVDNSRRAPDALKGVVYAAILFFIALFSFRQMHSWDKALVFTGSIFGAFVLLAAVGWLLMWVVRRLFPASWNYLWRQGFANLYRPNNQTLILIITIGLGTTFIGTLYFVRDMLIDRVTISAAGNQGNMVLFDIQTDQQSAVLDLLKQNQLPVLQQTPIVTMRMAEINGRTPEQAERERDSTGRAGVPPDRTGAPPDRRGSSPERDDASSNRPGPPPERAFESELRVTYRDSLAASEKIVAGKFGGGGNAHPGGSAGSSGASPNFGSAGNPVPISLEEEYARRLHVTIGDRIVFNVQGVLITTVVGSLRQVDWRRIQTNFRILFPSGVLESAPQFHVLVTRVPSPEVSARFQQAVVRNFSNISVIDLGLVLSVLDEILDKIGFVIRFMAAFSMLTGLVVLIASVLISKYQRIQEAVLLRTLGASRRQILVITALEYFFLGALAAATGILLSLAGSQALATFSFESSFSPHWGLVALLFVLVCGLTILIGLYNSRSVLNKPPLEILRSEV